MQPAIRVENLGKRYRIGLREQATQNFREALLGLATAPLRRLRRLREHTNGDDTIWALKDVSFEVEPGEVVGIIGRNGAGKTTLLKILSRITEPTEGRAELAGRVASLLEVGTGFHPELTGRENIYLNGAILGMKKAEIDRKFDEIVAFAETEKFLDTPVKRYSSGMYVRLAFAVAAHLEPEILLVDEVLAVGDAEFQKKCLGKMGDVARGGRTVLFVSHNMGAVRRLCGRCVHVAQGTVEGIGLAEQVVANYLDISISTSGHVDILRGERSTGLSAIIGGFTCKNESGSGPITPGSSVVFEIECHAPHTLRNATAGIHIISTFGDRVLCFNTRWERGPITLLKGKQLLRCHTADLPLAPGRYSVDLGLSSNGRQIDWVERAAVFDVEYADYFGTGEMPYPTQGNILKRARWTSCSDR